MKQPDDFLKFGKPLPYQEPDGFFDGLSQRTLEKAKQRTRTQRNFTIALKTLAVAASIAAVTLLATFMQENNPAPISTVSVPKYVDPIVVQDQAVIPKQEQVVVVENKTPEKETVVAVSEENVADVLVELTDEELLQVAAMFEADLFTDEHDTNN
jgi:hypothetical protein